jgi:hypothetical protein
MADRDGTRPKIPQEPLEMRPEYDDLQEPEYAMALEDTVLAPGQPDTPEHHAGMNHHVVPEDPTGSRYQNLLETRADLIMRRERNISRSEALRLAKIEVHHLVLESEQVPTNELAAKLAHQENMLSSMMEQMTTLLHTSAIQEERKIIGNTVPKLDHTLVKPDSTLRTDVNSSEKPSAQKESVESSVSTPEISQPIVTSTPVVRSSLDFTFTSKDDKNRKFKPMIPDTYCGDDSQSWESYINQFMVVCRYNSWTEEDALCNLLKSLRGQAANFLFDDPYAVSKANFQSLVAELAERFGSANNYDQDAKTLRDRKKQKGETFRDLAQSIRQISSRLYCNADIVEREAKHSFLRAIPDSYRTAAAAIASSPNSTLNTLVKAVKAIAASNDIDEQDVTVGRGRVNQVAVGNGNKPYGNKPYGYRNNSNNNNGSYRPGFSANIRCFWCHQAGHIKRNCPFSEYKERCKTCCGFGHHPEQCPLKSTPNTQSSPSSPSSSENSTESQ